MSVATTIAGLLVAALMTAVVVLARHTRLARAVPAACFAAFSFEALATYEQSAGHAASALLIVSALALITTFAILPIPWTLWDLGRDDDDEDDDGESEGGRGGPRRGGPGPDDEPPWWPQFERDLQRYVDRQRRRTRRPVPA